MENGKAITTRDTGAMLEQVVVKGDLRDLTEAQRVAYYNEVCKSIGVNPLTQPFSYITLNGKLTLYATRACTDQLRKVHRITAQVVTRERIEDVYVVTARVSTPDGRSDESIGAVAIGNLKGDALANALMKAETKAKRRATLSLVGLGWLDETEVETLPGARVESAPVVETKAPVQIPPPASPHNTVEQPECMSCHKSITGHKHGNTFYRPADIAERTRERFAMTLCWDCAERLVSATTPDEGHGPEPDPTPTIVQEQAF